MVPSSEFARVYRFYINVDGVEREVYLKQFLSRSSLEFIKSVFRGSRARRAFKAELMLARNNFDVPETLAIGEYRSRFFHTKSFSATFGIEDSKPVYRFICETTQEQLAIRREAIQAFGRIVGRMHAKNIFHGDLRLNNVLVRREGGNYRFFFLDNERTKKFSNLPFKRRVKNLVQVNMVPPDILGRTDRMRFFREYCAETGTGREEGKTLIAATIKKTRQRLDERNRTRKELKKTLRTKAGHLWIEAGNYQAMFGKSFNRETEAQDFIENLERLIKTGRILKEDGNCIVSQIRWNDREMAVKQYVPKGLIHSLRQTIGKSHAKLDWLNGHRPKMPNTAANKPLAYIERKRSGLVWKTYFVTEYNEM
ncbi:MAG: lipopolysaccharide kinase InaA family protein [Planctomycetota bacterium]